MDIEICVDSFEQASVAKDLSAKRIELCSALDIGGLTPSVGLTSLCSDLAGIEVHAMIRPRPGGFLYSSNEIQTMKLDIESLQSSGVRGVVFGVLKESGDLDLERNTELLSLAKSYGLEVTFHRAFDFVKNPMGSLEKLIELGFDRVLTSGQQPSAFEGIDLIKKLVLQSRGRIQIMAGSGVNRGNVQDLQDTGIDAIHFTARKPVNESFELGMGKRYEVDIAKINSILKVLS